MEKYNVQAIFNSIDGEVNGFHGSGELCTFIRLKGCNLRCSYCDTKYAQEETEGSLMTLEEIMECVVLPKVTITGGEPLMHGDLFKSLLLKLLRSNYYKVTVETNGSFIPYFTGLREDENLRYVLDYKLPSSGMMAKMNTDAFDILRPVDVIKFVISDLKDYDTAKALLRKGAVQSNWSAHKVFSPGIVDQKDFSGWPAKLAELLIADALWDDCLKNVQYSLQIHKVLWPNAVRER